MKAASRLAPSRAQRIAMRQAWGRETVLAWHEAQRQMNRRCDAAIHVLDEEAFERLIEAERKNVEAIRAQMDAVVERDMWPRHLHWGGI